MTIFEFFVLIFLAVPGAKSALSGQGGNLKSETGNGKRGNRKRDQTFEKSLETGRKGNQGWKRGM